MTVPAGDDLRQAERTLRPTAEQALVAWRAIVQAERDQVEQLPNRPRPEDFYAPMAQQFRADPDRADDPVLDHLLALTRADETWLDLGAGGGRYSLPLARRVRRVYAVEPSHGMRSVLADAIQADGAGNLDVFAERWPGISAVPVADVGLISHVGYDIEDIGPFLQQMEAHARRLCVAVLFERAPIVDYAPLWEPVHGVKRVLLPGLREFMTLLFARNCAPEATVLSLGGRFFPDTDALHAAARRPLWVQEGSAEDERLAGAVRELAVHSPDGFTIGPAVRNLGIVTWKPEAGGPGR